MNFIRSNINNVAGANRVDGIAFENRAFALKDKNFVFEGVAMFGSEAASGDFKLPPREVRGPSRAPISQRTWQSFEPGISIFCSSTCS
jgi:hypothetical protein